MTKRVFTVCGGVAAALLAQPAAAKVGVLTESTDYSGPYGKRQEMTIESSWDFGKTALVLNASHGKRKFEGASFKGYQLSTSVYRDWNERISSRTSVSLADNSPVFARRELVQDISYKLVPNALVTVGGKYASYYGGVDVASLHAGGSLYFRGGFATYRFGVHDVEGRGRQYSHLASVRLKDPKGSGQTQMWVSAGTALHEQEVVAAGRHGKYRGVHLQRVQPLAGPLALSLGLGRTWYDTPAGDYQGTKATVGFTISR